MSQHDEYDRNILRALQKIGKHLESIDKKLSISILRDLQKIEKTLRAWIKNFPFHQKR